LVVLSMIIYSCSTREDDDDDDDDDDSMEWLKVTTPYVKYNVGMGK
jgi:hypothetical protein